MTISDIFDYKEELDELLAKIGKHIEIWFAFVVEDSSGELSNEGYVNSTSQVKDCLKDTLSEDFAEEVFDALDSDDLYISSDGELDYNTLLDEDDYEVSYVIQLTIV